MGSNVSALRPPDVNGLPWFAIVFRVSDKIKIINGDEQVLQAVRNAISKYWHKGIQKEETDLGAYEFKFRGNPFSQGTGKHDTLQIKRTACYILSYLQCAGWQLVVSSDLSRTQDLSTWFFQKNAALVGCTAKPVACVSLSSIDALQLINAPQWLQPVLKEAVSSATGICNESVEQGPDGLDDYIVELDGLPWQNCDFEEGMKARQALLQMFAKFDAAGFKFIGNVDLKGTADSIFFQIEENRAPAERAYAMLSLNRKDSFRLLNVDETTVEAIRLSIRQHWPPGLRADKESVHAEFNAVELRMHGQPWIADGEEATAARLLITVILQVLLSRGWMLLCALDISRNEDDKGVFVLASCEPTSLQHFCLAPDNSDNIKLLNAPQDVFMAVDRCMQSWPYGIQRHHATYGGYLWKMKGSPWHPYSGNEYAHARLLLCALLHQLARLGWRAIASADVSARTYTERHGNHSRTYSLDTHSIFFAFTGLRPADADGGASEQAATAPTFSYNNYQSDEAPPSYSNAMQNQW